MTVSFTQISIPADSDRLIRFLTGDEWRFHVNKHLSKEKVISMIAESQFEGSNSKAFWISDSTGNDIGLIRLFDLEDVDDGYPMFDLRVRTEWRGKGIGKRAVGWLTTHLFETYPQLDRVCGSTRADNVAMRKTFAANGYVKEGHFRKDWTSADGEVFNTVMYAILRHDWITGNTTPVLWNDEP